MAPRCAAANRAGPWQSQAAPLVTALAQLASVRRIMTRVILIVALVVVGVPALIYLLWVIHCTLDRVSMRHARRFCTRSGLDARRVRCQPAFEPSGVKTEVHARSARLF